MALKYRDIADRIDVDAFEEAIDFIPIEQTENGEDRGHCIDVWGMHKHGDTTGKMSIHREKRVFNCWVCGGGSLLSLAMAVRDCTEQEAIEWLHQFTYGIEQLDDDYLSDIDRLLSKEMRKDAVLPYFNENVIKQWKTTDHPWLVERGISPDIAESHHVGFNPTARRASSRGNFLGEAIIFPHIWKTKLVGWQERWLGERPTWLPKYTNTGSFPRAETIYGYEDVYLAESPIIVAESVPTVLFLKSIGLPAVATFGSSVTPEQIRLLRGCQQGIFIAPDNDEAGEKFFVLLYDGLKQYVRLGLMPPPSTALYGEGADLGNLVDDIDEVHRLYSDAFTLLSDLF